MHYGNLYVKILLNQVLIILLEMTFKHLCGEYMCVLCAWFFNINSAYLGTVITVVKELS